MVHERQPPRALLRHSMLEEEVGVNEDGMPERLLDIETIEQLTYWIKKDSNAVLRSLAEVKQNLTETTAEYNNQVNELDEYKMKKREELKILRDELDKRSAIPSIENVGLKPKSERSPKLPDPPIFSDNKEPDIDE